jgi:hypothetical protein
MVSGAFPLSRRRAPRRAAVNELAENVPEFVLVDSPGGRGAVAANASTGGGAVGGDRVGSDGGRATDAAEGSEAREGAGVASTDSAVITDSGGASGNEARGG